MLSPGSKGWINKYFSLVEEGVIKLDYQRANNLSSEYQLHLISGKTGIVFGYASRFIFFEEDDSSLWTEDEKLKTLLFETLLFVYIQKNGVKTTLKDDFINSLLDYYANHNSGGLKKWLSFWVKEDSITQLENVFDKRINVSKGFFDNRWWFKTMSNVFVFLDVVLYYSFLNKDNPDALNSYSEYAYDSLIVILLAANADGNFDELEKSMYKTFLSAANLDAEYKELVNSYIKNGVTHSALSELVINDKLFSHFILDLALLTIYGNNEVKEVERIFAEDLTQKLQLTPVDLDESSLMIEHFLLYSNLSNSYLSNKKTYEKMYGNLSARWSKIIVRNKDKIANELKESKDLVSLIKKSTTQELSSEEKEKVKTQFLDLAKTVPALTIFMLPGGALLLPLVLKLLPDLIPSAFKENEIDK